MPLQDSIKDHIVVVVALTFAAGAGTAWTVSDEIRVAPRDYEIQRLEQRLNDPSAMSRSSPLQIEASNLSDEQEELDQFRNEAQDPHSTEVHPDSHSPEVARESQDLRGDAREPEMGHDSPSVDAETSAPPSQSPKVRITVNKLEIVDDCQGFSFLGVKGEYTYEFRVNDEMVAVLNRGEARERDGNDEIEIGQSADMSVAQDGESVVRISASVWELNKTKGVLQPLGDKSVDLLFESGRLKQEIQPLDFTPDKNCHVRLWYEVSYIE